MYKAEVAKWGEEHFKADVSVSSYIETICGTNVAYVGLRRSLRRYVWLRQLGSARVQLGD